MNKFIKYLRNDVIKSAFRDTVKGYHKLNDSLIAGTGRKVATTLQLLKETGMRIGEAWNLEWIDIDNQNQTITCTPEKHGTPRQFKVSSNILSFLTIKKML